MNPTGLKARKDSHQGFLTINRSHAVTVNCLDSSKKEEGVQKKTKKNHLGTPSQRTAGSSQHPVNTVHLGYLLFERCDKQRQTCIVNT